MPAASSYRRSKTQTGPPRWWPDALSARGHASFGPPSELLYGLDPAVANGHVLCLVMIETLAGVRAAEEICGTPGVDGIYVGPADLAVSLGLAPAMEPGEGEHSDAVHLIRRIATNRGLVVGIHAGSGRQAARRAAEGFSLITIGTDVTLLRSGRGGCPARRSPRGGSSGTRGFSGAGSSGVMIELAFHSLHYSPMLGGHRPLLEVVEASASAGFSALGFDQPAIDTTALAGGRCKPWPRHSTRTACAVVTLWSSALPTNPVSFVKRRGWLRSQRYWELRSVSPAS